MLHQKNHHVLLAYQTSRLKIKHFLVEASIKVKTGRLFCNRIALMMIAEEWSQIRRRVGTTTVKIWVSAGEAIVFGFIFITRISLLNISDNSLLQRFDIILRTGSMLEE